MRQPQDRYEFPIEWRDWCTGAGQPASLLWLEGRTWLAGIGTRAEEILLASGAVPVGLLRFDPDPIETVHRDGHVTRFSPRQLLSRIADHLSLSEPPRGQPFSGPDTPPA